MASTSIANLFSVGSVALVKTSNRDSESVCNVNGTFCFRTTYRSCFIVYALYSAGSIYCDVRRRLVTQGACWNALCLMIRRMVHIVYHRVE
jgi:hypothetical protein